MITLIKPNFFCFVFILFLFFLIPHTALASAADIDYQSYKSTKYASGKYNSYVKQGFEAYHSEDYEGAKTALYKAFNEGCESPIVLFMLANLMENEGSFYTALEYYQMAQKGFKKVNKEHRFNQTFDENYGRALYLSGKKKEALPLLKRASKKSKSYWLFKLLGMISYEKGDTLNAVSYLERAVRVKSNDVTRSELVYVYSLLGKLFLHKGEQDGAYRYYQKVLELDANNPEARQFMNVIEKNYRNKEMMKVVDELKDI